MSTITAADVKKLRDLTGAGMMDCKKALSEANGNLEEAMDYLRKKGQKLSAKRADRSATEGVVLALVNDTKDKGVVVRLSCETDFVAKNENFVNLTKSFANLALENFPNTLEELLQIPYEGITIGEKVTEQTGVIGEKLELAAYEKLEATMVAPYIHMGNKAGVLIGLNESSDAVFDAGRDVAMQVAAMQPIAVDQNGVDQNTIDKEIEIAKEQLRAEGKPEEMLEKISMGKLNRFFKDNTLLNQAFVKDGSMNVQAFLKSVSPELTVTDFKHVKLG